MRKVLILMAILLTGCGSPMPTAGAADPNIQLAVAAAQLTGTAQSVEWTATAQVSGWTATAQSWTATPSPVPTATMTPSITPTPTIDVTMTIAVERMNAEIKEMNQQAEFRSIFTPLLVVVALALLILGIAYVAITISRSKDFQVIERGEGDAPLVLSRSRRRVLDMDANPNFSAGFDESLLRAAFAHWLKEKFGVDPVMPQITAERQDAVKGRDQMIDMKSRTKVSTAAVAKLLENQGLNKALPAPASSSQAITPIEEDDFNLPLPPWDFIRGWDGNSKPLGFGRKGLITARGSSPHLLISGQTGAGKTVYMLRTLATASLATGAQLINIGYSESGYGVFASHPNYHSVQLPQAAAVVECLAQVYDELRQRKALIGGDLVEWETWPGSQPPRPFLDLLMDELGNMAEDIYVEQGPALNREMWSLVSRIANEGRKVGIRIMAALQDPTAKSMDLRFRRNCTLVSFRQGDRSQSDAFGTPGAENLPVGHFIARTDALVSGGGFSPTDAEIMQYLNTRRVPALEAPRWVEALKHPRLVQEAPVQIIEPTAPESLPVTVTKPIDEIAEMAERIRSQWSQGMSGRQVAKLLNFSQYGGSLKTKTDKVIEYLTATTQSATTTENQPEMGSFEAIPA